MIKIILNILVHIQYMPSLLCAYLTDIQYANPYPMRTHRSHFKPFRGAFLCPYVLDK